MWGSHYRLHGIDGLHPKRSAIGARFNLQALAHQDREQLSSRQVAALYDIPSPTRSWSSVSGLSTPFPASTQEWRVAKATRSSAINNS